MSRQGGWLYETHFHTSLGSACGRSRGPEYLERYRRLGYDGIIVTDHFWRGNCAVDRHMPWRHFVDAFCRGYEETRVAADPLGLKVFFGWEETHEGDDYLVYGLDKAWLYEHPEVREWTRQQQLDEVHRFGGCVVQAHPFRDRDYIGAIHLGPADAYEVGNAGNLPAHDVQAHAFAEAMGYAMTAGSDIHHAQQHLDDELMGVETDRPLHSIADFCQMIRSGQGFRPRLPQGRCAGQPLMPLLRVYDHRQEKTRRIRRAEELFQRA